MVQKTSHWHRLDLFCDSSNVHLWSPTNVFGHLALAFEQRRVGCCIPNVLPVFGLTRNPWNPALVGQTNGNNTFFNRFQGVRWIQKEVTSDDCIIPGDGVGMCWWCNIWSTLAPSQDTLLVFRHFTWNVWTLRGFRDWLQSSWVCLACLAIKLSCWSILLTNMPGFL